VAASFTPEVQWEWEAPDSNGSMTMPLVGNFTDDNDDGQIDLCDVPDILVTVMGKAGGSTIYALAGDTGAVELVFSAPVGPDVTPAFADIDGDGLPELVAVSPTKRLMAFEHDGSVKWTGETIGLASSCVVIAIYDLDGDGSAEILAGYDVFDAQGQRLWGLGKGPGLKCPTPSAADLDGDGVLEVLFGHAAHRADGTLLWQVPGDGGHAHVANFDADPEPEVLITGWDGIQVVEADGTPKLAAVEPTGGPYCGPHPGVVHDFDGDGQAEFAMVSCSDFTVYEPGSTTAPKWTASVTESVGTASTAFDFLGDGIADAVVSDETAAHVFDGATGAVELMVPRSSGTMIEYPIVADVDNDRSAEIVVISNWGWLGQPESGPTVTVFRDAQDRWIQARRIWNQHAYHVTNIREDGRLPTPMQKSWQRMNTFRANAQIEGVDCRPEPPK
jgi:hypothetical protein